MSNTTTAHNLVDRCKQVDFPSFRMHVIRFMHIHNYAYVYFAFAPVCYIMDLRLNIAVLPMWLLETIPFHFKYSLQLMGINAPHVQGLRIYYAKQAFIIVALVM